MESFLGHMIAGGVFCLFGGQPLTVLGCTGPVSFYPCVSHIYSFSGSRAPLLFPRTTQCLLFVCIFHVPPQVLIFEKILVEFCHSYGELKNTWFMFVRFFAHTHEIPFVRYLLSHNAPLDWTLGGLLLSYNRCCGWFCNRQIFHKVSSSS